MPSGYTAIMRVVAGTYRGRTLTTPPGAGTRPILDRVKVALFDWLGSTLAQPGSLPPLNVLDVFCGGGSIGIECLSRGAAFCTFIDCDRQALIALRKNLRALAINRLCRVIAGPAESAPIAPPPDGRYGLIFLDPPYRLNDAIGPGTVIGRTLHHLAAAVPIDPDALLIWRHETHRESPAYLPGKWTLADRRGWGSVTVSLFRNPPAERTL